MRKHHIEDRLRSFARMVTGNYKLKVMFTGDTASITKVIPMRTNKPRISFKLVIPPLKTGRHIPFIQELQVRLSAKDTESRYR
ncbi:MAG: hypothetical protein QG641_1293 [Candidatus Poribacteria bacterium]|nr:hypothetical protein [Candidatus Poribacteria bacterium]